MATDLVDSVIHWRKKLDKNLDEKELLISVIRKLSKIPITLEILEITHIGNTIRKLSKRDDEVGEKALSVLKKWRYAFANQESSNRNSKPPSVSKKENTKKESKSSSKRDATHEKTINHHKEASHHEYKYKHMSLSHSSPERSSKKYVSSNYNANNSIESSPSIYSYEKKDSQAKYIDYDPQADIDEGYNPECPELFPGDKSLKTKKSDSVGEPKSSQKHKLKPDEQAEYASKTKKLKYESHANSNSSYSESKKSQEKKEKHGFHKEKNKDHKSHSSGVKKESTDKAKSESAHGEKQKTSSDSKKSKIKNPNENSSAKCSKSKTKLKLNYSEEFTSSEVRFEDCLGLNDIVTLKKKKNSKPQVAPKKVNATVNNNSKPTKPTTTSSPGQEMNIPKATSHSFKDKTVTVPKPSMKLDVVDIMSTLPEIQPNYRPLPQRSLDSLSSKKKEVLSNEDAIRFTSSRNEKTAVYSGRKTFYTEPPSLQESCIKILIENINAIEYMGDVPFYLIKPLLRSCTPFQLYDIEHYNPNLLADTHKLWHMHCKKDFKLVKPQENETWRDLYVRAYEEREKKLKRLTANIAASMSKSSQVRQVKLAFVDSVVKPPRDVARRQAKNGTARPLNKSLAKPGSPSKSPKRPAAAARRAGVSSSASTSFSPASKKPKPAPLMAKMLKSIKGCYQRR